MNNSVMADKADNAALLDASSGVANTGGPRLKVLIVEDSLTEQVRIKAMSMKNGYDVLTASNGTEALEILDKEKIRLIVSDWRMPELTGIDLCRKIKAHPEYGNPYFILLTGFNTQSDLVAGMDAGADDFISKPVGNEEFRVRMQAGARIVNLRGEIEQQYQQLEQGQQLIQRDLDAAAKMQRELLPDGKSPFQTLSIATLFKPAVTVAGDSFGYFKLDQQHLAFYHLDVAGHGIASAMLSFTLARYLSPALIDELVQEPTGKRDVDNTPLDAHIVRPETVVSMLNDRFQESQECNHYFTMIYGVINVDTGKGAFTQAGHPHPLIIRQDGEITKLGTGGFPVGMFAEAEYESTPIEIQNGERLYLFSDGITDTTNIEGVALGQERYEHILKRISQHPLDKAIEAIDTTVTRWNGDQPFDDDISLLVIERH